jgi:hypothetical protein
MNNANCLRRAQIFGMSLCAFLCAILAACDNGFALPAASGLETVSSSAATTVSGSLSISLPSTAAWLAALQGEGGAADTHASNSLSTRSRALARASSVKVEIYKDGTPVIDAVTLDSYKYGVGGTSSTSTVSNIPVGSGYTVNVSVYSAYTSTTTPIVTGTASSVEIKKNATTSLTIQCLPNNPMSLSLGTSVSSVLASQAEKWYSATVTSGTTYYFTQDNGNCAIGIFDDTGTYIASDASYIKYSAAYTGTLYLVVANSYSSGSVTSALCMSTALPVLNEGSASSPVALTFDAAHTFKTGPAGDQDTSYYTITTTSAGTYALSTAYGYYTAILYSDSSFSTGIPSASSAYGAIFNGLAAGKQYWLKLTDCASSGLNISGKIISSAAIAADTSSEGIIASPITLTDSVAHLGKVGNLIYNATSYYKFTAGAGNDYRLSLTGVSPESIFLTACVGSDSLFASNFDSLWTGSSESKDITLAPGSTYYIQVISSGSNSSNCAYSLSISAIAAPSFTALPVVTANTWTSGSVTTAVSGQWYKATVEPSTNYTLFYDDSSSNSSSTYTLSGAVTVYDSSRSTVLLSYCLYSGKMITTGAADTTIYIKVASGNGNTGTFALKLIKP